MASGSDTPMYTDVSSTDSEFELGSGMDPEGSPAISTAAIIGASVGGAACFLLLLCCCVLVVVCVVRRKKKVPLYAAVKKPDPLKGITNAMYTFDGDIEVKTSTGVKNHDYSLPHDINHKPLENTSSYTYAYASIERKIPQKKTSVTEGRSKQSGSKYGRDQNYMVPACEEMALYAQIIDMRISELPRTSIELGEVIGNGNFGTVNQGVMKSSGKGDVEVAVKTLKEGSVEQDRVRFLQEATIMGQFKHPNVVKLHGVVIEDEPVLIVLELLSKGDLRNHLLSQRSGPVLTIDEHTLLSYCRQVASGMVYLSNMAFIHRDIAARNILLSEQGLCKIADFGLSRDLMDEEYYVSQGGKIPVKWTAPEAINYRKYSTASDVWSFGVLLFEIWSLGHKPYEDCSIPELIRRLEDGYRLAPPPGTPRAVYELMINTWDPISSLRPSFSDVMQQLSMPDTMLLQETGEDASTSAKLGAELSEGSDLYADLQNKYM